MRWSDDYYVANGGGCRRVPFDVDGKVIDASVDVHALTKCTAEGEHPHAPKGKLVGPERTVER
jgi:hypothetical protein